MAKKRSFKKRISRAKFNLPVAVIAGFAPGAGRLIYHATHNDYGQGNPISNVGVEAGRIFLGYDSRTGQFDARNMMYGLLPVILGGMVHKFIGGTLGLNRTLARSGVPLLRL